MITFKKILGFTLLILLVFSISDDALAQRKQKGYLKRKNKKISKYRVGSIHFDKNKQYAAFAFGVSSMNYFGDIAPQQSIASTDLKLTRPGFTVSHMWRFHQNMFLRSSFTWARIKGDDFKANDPYDANGGGAYRYVRNLHFRNDIKELSAIISWDILSNHGTFLNRLRFTPYLFAGAGVFYHNPRAMAPNTDRNGNPLPDAGKYVSLEPLGTEGQYSSNHPEVKPYSKIQFALPGGIGMRFLMNKRWDFEAEVGYRWMFFDYIDDISGTYIDLGALDGDLAKVMSDRSMEQTAANAGEPRDFDAINSIATVHTYTSLYDGNTYTTYAGYGHETDISVPSNNRGGSNGNDVILSLTFRVVYIITGSFKRAKFR